MNNQGSEQVTERISKGINTQFQGIAFPVENKVILIIAEIEYNVFYLIWGHFI